MPRKDKTRQGIAVHRLLTYRRWFLTSL